MPSSLANADGLNDFEDDGFEFSSSFSSKIDDDGSPPPRCDCCFEVDGFGANPAKPLKTPAPPFGGGFLFSSSLKLARPGKSARPGRSLFSLFCGCCCCCSRASLAASGEGEPFFVLSSSPPPFLLKRLKTLPFCGLSSFLLSSTAFFTPPETKLANAFGVFASFPSSLPSFLDIPPGRFARTTFLLTTSPPLPPSSPSPAFALGTYFNPRFSAAKRSFSRSSNSIFSRSFRCISVCLFASSIIFLISSLVSLANVLVANGFVPGGAFPSFASEPKYLSPCSFSSLSPLDTLTTSFSSSSSPSLMVFLLLFSSCAPFAR